MQIRYDDECDILSVLFVETPVPSYCTDPIADGIMIRRSLPDGECIGFTVYDFAKRVREHPQMSKALGIATPPYLASVG